MAFTVDLFQFQKRENSTKRPNMADASSFQCVLKDETGILNPQILLDIGITNAPSLYNYAYIQSFNRYYWIEEWINEGKLWRANLKVDTLATYKEDLGNQDFYILRSANEWDGNVIDTLYPTKVINTYERLQNASMFANVDMQYGMFVLGIIGTQAKFGSVDYVSIPAGDLWRLTTYLLDNNTLIDNGFNSDGTQAVYDASLSLQKALIDPLSYIKSCIYIPSVWMEYPTEVHTGATDPLMIWDFACKDVNWKRIDYANTYIIGNGSFSITDHPQKSQRGEYCNCAPYTTRTFNCASFGSLDIDTTLLIGASSILYEWKLDVITGLCSLDLFAIKNQTRVLLSHLESQIGVNVQLAQVSQSISMESFGKSLVGSAVEAVGEFFGAGQEITGIGSGLKAQGMKQYSIGSQSSYLKVFNSTPYLDSVFYEIVDDDLAQNGRPLCKIRKPKNLGGYMLVQDADVQLIATSEEIASVKSFMQGGFHYE